MNDPQELPISGFTYDLPKEKIALYPLEQRDAARLLIYKSGTISESTFTHLADQLPSASLLVFNNTRVVPARLLFYKNSGSKIEVFALEPLYPNDAAAYNTPGSINYLCLVKGSARWKAGPLVKTGLYNGEKIALTAVLIEKKTEAFHIHFTWQPAALSFNDILHAFGEMPIPPYLHRPAEQGDLLRYQTIYARHDGSVAAPTAGLHFTNAVMQSLQQKNIEIAYTTLHVGIGTFKPVKSETLAGHQMHAEWITIEKSLLEKLLTSTNIIPVGTTSMRTLESIYWLSLKTFEHPEISSKDLHLTQWEVYRDNWPQGITAQAAITAFIQWMERNRLTQLITQTQILIAPGYTFRICQGLITNFHQPQSTLLLLIAAFIGDDWKKVYDYALENDFRFLSYGDGSYLTPYQYS